MKLRHASVAALAGLAGLAGLGLLACNHPQRRNDWRTPSQGGPPATCTSDADCARTRGTCTLEIGATQGTCTPAPGLSPTERMPHGDGGAPSQPGLPNHQPSSSDIQI